MVCENLEVISPATVVFVKVNLTLKVLVTTIGAQGHF